MSEIWTGSRALDGVRRVTADAKNVVADHGDDGPLLNFCPGLAAAHGDALRIYPGALQRATLIREVQAVRKPVVLRVLTR